MNYLISWKTTKTVPSLTLQHYILKKNGYNHHFNYRDFDVIENKPIFCNDINILYCTLIKLVLKYGPYHVDSFGKNWKSSMLEIEKMFLDSRCQPPWSAILEKVSHIEKVFFAITL